MTVRLTELQEDLLDSLEVGIIYDVGTSIYSNSRATGYWKPDRYSTTQTIKGLEKKGLIEITDLFWRGATIRRIK